MTPQQLDHLFEIFMADHPEFSVKKPIIRSMLDTDAYKLFITQVVFNQFPEANVTFEFINRNNTPFPEGFADALMKQIKLMESLRFTEDEIKFISNGYFLKPNYLAFLKNYQFDSSEIVCSQDGGKLWLTANGPWYRVSFWEVPLMALISELYFKMLKATPDDEWLIRCEDKARNMLHACGPTTNRWQGLQWADFGTRRRFSYEIQRQVIEAHSQFINPHNAFIGTSNVHFAHKYGLKAVGTQAHEGIMALQAKVGFREANKAWLDAWIKEYHGNFGIALPDTLTSEVFLRDFDSFYARLFDGLRQDSGDPITVGETYVKHYQKLGIDPRTKRIIFSDNLNDRKAIAIQHYFAGQCIPVFGIGTFLTNDVGAKPLNMVIKLVRADFGHGSQEVVKLSDDTGKHLGSSRVVEIAKRDLCL